MGAQTGKPNPSIREDIINTALEFRLMSQYTSFVAVEQQVVNVSGELKTVDVPVEMPEGVSYDGIFGDTAKEKKLRGASKLALSRSAGNYAFYSQTAPSRPASPGAYGLSGGVAASAAQPSAKPVVSALPSLSVNAAEPPTELGDDLAAKSLDGSAIRRNDKDAMDALGKMEAGDRLSALRSAKLDPALIGLADKVKAEGENGTLKKAGLPEVVKGRVTVQVWLNSLPADGLAKLMAAGFTKVATLQPNRLLLGTVDVGKLDALIELGFVARVEPPAMK
jgi:Ca-activated chloride channel family protein